MRCPLLCWGCVCGVLCCGGRQTRAYSGEESDGAVCSVVLHCVVLCCIVLCCVVLCSVVLGVVLSVVQARHAPCAPCTTHAREWSHTRRRDHTRAPASPARAGMSETLCPCDFQQAHAPRRSSPPRTRRHERDAVPMRLSAGRRDCGRRPQPRAGQPAAPGESPLVVCACVWVGWGGVAGG